MSLKNPKFGKKSTNLSKLSNINKINVDFYDNFFNKSLVLILKYTVCKVYSCTTVFKEIRIFKILKKIAK